MSFESNFLEENEFLILKEETCHIANINGIQLEIFPSVLYLTNFRIIINSQYFEKSIISVNHIQITKFSQRTHDETQILVITTDSEIGVHFPETLIQNSLCKIFCALCEAWNKSEAEGKYFSYGLRNCFYESDTNFYSNIDAIIKLLSASSDEKNREMDAFFSSISRPVSFTLSVVSSIANLDEHLCLFFFVIFCGLLSLLFSTISFGICICSFVVFLIVRSGFSVTFKRNSAIPSDEREKPQRFQDIYEQYEKAECNFFKRFWWKEPKKTIDTLLFFLSLGFLFSFFEPDWILFFGIVIIAFFENWDPFDTGNLYDLFSDLKAIGS